ncbi:cobalt ECF transporter T component CbiQ [Pleomorphomonas oryzae]|uniref:cobalt ECF transporter T component CbiQ n=1 Tax=Pleomorphomonas oryzae TaxID=261934 RepID=UPI00040EFC70|nr:cobalt ECF transporter T component CbiQ [Pleomorphomonas oryzae]
MNEPAYGVCSCGGKKRRGLLESLVFGLIGVESHSLEAETTSVLPGLLQRFDPRIKVVALLALIIAAVSTQRLTVLALMFALATGLALLSKIRLIRLARQVWLGVFLFSGIIVLPAVFIVPGEAITHLPLIGWPITLQGLRSAAFVIGRAETAATLSLLLVLTTPWPHVLKALRSLGVPAAIVAILGMTYRYIFVLTQSALQMAEARQSRLMAPLDGPARRRLMLTMIGTLLTKTLALGTEVHAAMVARGYRGEVRLLDDFRTRPADWAFLLAALGIAATIIGARL